MLFWLTAGLLTIAAVAAVLLPLARRAPVATGRHDLAVYRDQYAEIDRDIARGLLSKDDGEAARLEISRRLLKAGDEQTKIRPASLRSSRLIGATAVLSVPLVAWGVYAATGSPDLPSQPLQARLEADPGEASVDELVARAEDHLRRNADDGRGWDVIAPIYVRLGRAQDAVAAYENAIRLLGSSADREAGLGEALVVQSNGAIGPGPIAAFERALSLQPDNAKASFYLATADAQQGRFQPAAERLREMLATLPQESRWRTAVAQALSEIDAQIAAATVQPTGPTASQVEEAATLSAAERSAMIEGMVAQLDAKLRDDPNDPEGWQRLVRSYVVLGRSDEALTALERGIAAMGEQQGADLARFAAGLGVGRAKQE